MALFFNLSSVYHIHRNMKVNTRQNSLDLKAVAPGVVGIGTERAGHKNVVFSYKVTGKFDL